MCELKGFKIQATEQGNELEMNRSSGSAYVPSLLSVPCTVKCYSSLMVQ